MISAPPLRLGLGVAGIVAAVCAVALDSHAAAWVAVVLLGAAVVIRLVAKRRAPIPTDRDTD